MFKPTTMICIVSLLICLAGNAFGAVHSLQWKLEYFGNEHPLKPTYIPPASAWFSIKPEESYFNLDLLANSNISSNQWYLGMEEYRNEQRFGSFEGLYDPDSKRMDAKLKINYLTDFGFFVGMDYNGSKELLTDPTYTSLISPGYRFNLNKQGYLALSIDYFAAVPDPYKVIGYDLDLQYTWQRLKTTIQLYKKPDIGTAPVNDFYHDLLMEFQVTESLTLGSGYAKSTGGNAADNTAYYNGLTWNTRYFILNGKTGFDDYNFYDINGIIKFSPDILFSIDYVKSDFVDEPRLTFEFKSKAENLNVSILYIPRSNSWPETWAMLYKIQPIEDEL